jgi:hypothetical protein
MNVYTIGHDIDESWSWIEPMLDEVYAGHRSGYRAVNALEDIRAARTLVLVIEDGTDRVVSLLTRQPDALHVSAAVGQGIDTWGGVAETVLTEIAQSMGVSHITSQARKGWAKLQTERHGWKEHGVYISRAV